MSVNSQHDAREVPVSACAPQSLEDFETALVQFHSYFGDPVETLQATLNNDPEFVLGHIFVASAMLLMGERQYIPAIRNRIERAEALSAKSNDREKMLVHAARQWMEGRWDKACETWDRVLTDYPRDAMALQLAHLTDFFRGDALNLRDRVGRTLTHWHRDVPGYSYIQGMYAFGLEECNQHKIAEETGYYALSIEPRDGWAVHAIAHVLEMQGRYDEGITLYTERVNDWAPDNGFAFHNWWHFALYYMERDDFNGALGLYDSRILPQPCDLSSQLLDASALLWRLMLQGVDTGSRWDELADMWASKTELENGYYAFNDFHALIAFVGAERLSAAREILAAVENTAAHSTGLNAMMSRDVGIPACRAMLAFGEKRYAETVSCLVNLRPIANRFGGSHAQRDILSQTLLDAAIRDGQLALASNLLSERKCNKPMTPLSKRYETRIYH